MDKSLRGLCLAAAFGAGLALAGCANTAQQSAADDLVVYSGRPVASYHIAVADFEQHQILTGASATVPKPAVPKVPGSHVGVKKSAKAGADDALTLQFKDAWYASLRVEGGKPLDLRPYLAQGVLAFDLKVDNMAQGGVSFKVGCGKDCERQVAYLLPARAAAGKGWQRVAFAMSCFVRDGDDFSAVTNPFALDASGSGDVSIANITFQKAGRPNASCPDYKTVSVTPDLLNESWSINWWLPRHEKKLQEVKELKAQNKQIDLVFIGDSITEGWEKDGQKVFERNYKKFNTLALGFGGDRTENVLWRLQHGAVDGINPKVAVLMFGTNNTGHRQENPVTTAAGIKRNIDELQRRLPSTKILLLAIFPRDEKPDGKSRQINDKVNAIIAGFADNKRVFFLDINKALLEADGTLSKNIMPDLLHPNEKGYEIWAASMEPALLKLMQKK